MGWQADQIFFWIKPTIDSAHGATEGIEVPTLSPWFWYGVGTISALLKECSKHWAHLSGSQADFYYKSRYPFAEISSHICCPSYSWDNNYVRLFPAQLERWHFEWAQRVSFVLISSDKLITFWIHVGFLIIKVLVRIQAWKDSAVALLNWNCEANNNIFNSFRLPLFCF